MNTKTQEKEIAKLAKTTRIGNFYRVKKNGKYTKTVASKTGGELIGQKAEKRNSYENKIGRRSATKQNNIKVNQGLNSHSIAIQFPSRETLANGKHRYFLKYGVLIDRAS